MISSKFVYHSHLHTVAGKKPIFVLPHSRLIHGFKDVFRIKKTTNFAAKKQTNKQGKGLLITLLKYDRKEIMKKYVMIVASGKGLRMESELPKQFIPINGKPILMHTIEVFNAWNPDVEIILVILQEHESYWKMLCEELNCPIPHKIVFGGETRFHSVKNGLSGIAKKSLIAIHDGVRPFVTGEVITNCFSAAEKFGAAIPVLPMIDSVREIISDDESKPFDRERLRIVQTPQVFVSDILVKSYEHHHYNESFTDDASVVESAGYKVHLVSGNQENIKITIPADLTFFERNPALTLKKWDCKD